MADALAYIATKFNLDLHARRLPIEIPDANRVTLARLFFLLGYTKGVEVGVERAVYSDTLLTQNPLLHLTLVDAWKAYRGYRDHVSQGKLDGFFEQTCLKLSGFSSARVNVRRQFSVDAARDFEDGWFDFVYLDAAHDLASVIADLKAWTPKVRVGGIIAGHDYLKVKLPSLMHVPQALHAWTDAYQIAPWFVLGRQAKVDGELRDDGRSWFYVKAAPIDRNGKIKQ